VSAEYRRPVFPDVPEEGLFGPDSMIWKINRENVVLLGGPAAAILQIAHPSVARGVIEHSQFQYDALGRLRRTLDAIYAIAFGDGEEVNAMAARIARRHEKVRGEMPRESGRAGAPEAHSSSRPSYSAFDPDLQLWVLATLVFTAVDLYERFVGPLASEEKERYLREMRLWGVFFGLERSYGPQGWAAYHDFYQAMLQGPLLGSDSTSATITEALVHPTRPRWLAFGMPLMEFLATELIPSPVRERLGLCSRGWTRTAWRMLGRGLPPIYRVLPAGLRFAAAYRRAVRRWPQK